MWYCYLIKSDENITYIGITNDIEHRLKAHNKIIAGGAKATRKGNNWQIIKTVEFDNKSEASSFEWNAKYTKTKKGTWRRTSGIHERMQRFQDLLKQYDK